MCRFVRCWNVDSVVTEKDRDQFGYRGKNEEILRGVNKRRNTLHKIKQRKSDCIGHILRRNCPMKHTIEEI
jgi:hypothetical protein